MIYVGAPLSDFNKDIEFRVVFRRNNFTGVVIRNPLFKVQSTLKNAQIYIENNLITGSYLSNNIPITQGIISVSGDGFSVYMNNNTFNNLSLDSIVTINGGDSV